MVERSFSEVNHSQFWVVASTARLRMDAAINRHLVLLLAISVNFGLKSFIYRQKNNKTADTSSRRRLLSECSPAPAAFMARQNLCMVLGGGAMCLSRSMLMTHQLTAKKGSFEIPPLNWKAPGSNKQSDRHDAPSRSAETSKQADVSRVKS